MVRAWMNGKDVVTHFGHLLHRSPQPMETWKSWKNQWILQSWHFYNFEKYKWKSHEIFPT